MRKRLSLLVLLVILPILLNLTQRIQHYLGRASEQTADIVVDAATVIGPINPIWQALAQGGEEKYPFTNIINEISELRPTYIRIDHIYDFYNVVEKKNGQITFNFTELDRIVDDILATGATPFLSLSYMPPAISKDGQITSPPAEWEDWARVIQETIQYYSGRNQRNLTNMVYEVWNEPDLFGNWRIGGVNDYRTLYRFAILGAGRTQNTNPFKIGGPSTTAPYKTWVNDFLDYVIQNRLRLDFYSWHRYDLQPKKFLEDVDKIDAWMFKNAGHSLEKYVTEWGSNSENSPVHDNVFDAAHLVAVSRQLLQRVDKAFIFEIKDGPDVTSGKKYWGRWGLLTHEIAGSIEKKPKYYSLQLLNKMVGNRLSFEGEGTWITGFAAVDGSTTRIILTNLDPQNTHFENVPVKIVNLENGSYSYKENSLVRTKKEFEEIIDNNTLSKLVPLMPNDVVVLEITKK